MTAATIRTRPQRRDFGYFHQLRIRFAEIDYQCIVFNAHYLTYSSSKLDPACAAPANSMQQGFGIYAVCHTSKNIKTGEEKDEQHVEIYGFGEGVDVAGYCRGLFAGGVQRCASK
jgi:hypothetical protein